MSRRADSDLNKNVAAGPIALAPAGVLAPHYRRKCLLTLSLPSCPRPLSTLQDKFPFRWQQDGDDAGPVRQRFVARKEIVAVAFLVLARCQRLMKQ